MKKEKTKNATTKPREIDFVVCRAHYYLAAVIALCVCVGIIKVSANHATIYHAIAPIPTRHVSHIYSFFLCRVYIVVAGAREKIMNIAGRKVTLLLHYYYYFKNKHLVFFCNIKLCNGEFLRSPQATQLTPAVRNNHHPSL